MATQRVNIGSVYTEHAVPPGALVVERKYCEICGRSFSRRFAATEVYAEYIVEFTVMLNKPPLEVRTALRKDHGERFCADCRGRLLMPDIEAQVKYLIQLPGTPQQMRHAPHVPKYDRTLFGRETSAHELSKKPVRAYRARKHHKRGDWLPLLRAAFAERGKLKSEDLVDVVPGCLTPQQAYMKVYFADAPIRIVAWEKEAGLRGRGKAIYEWPGVSPNSSTGGAGRASRPDVAPGGPCNPGRTDCCDSGLPAQPGRGQSLKTGSTRPADLAPHAEHRGTAAPHGLQARAGAAQPAAGPDRGQPGRDGRERREEPGGLQQAPGADRE